MALARSAAAWSVTSKTAVVPNTLHVPDSPPGGRRLARAVAIAGEPGEGPQVGQALAALDAPVVLPPDR